MGTSLCNAKWNTWSKKNQRGDKKGQKEERVSLPRFTSYPPFSFCSEMSRKRKQKQGEQRRQKQVSVSWGTRVERWIRPGFGRVKWAPAIKSRQAKRQELLSSELKADTEGQWRVQEGEESCGVWRSCRSLCTCIIQQTTGGHHAKSQ